MSIWAESEGESKPPLTDKSLLVCEENCGVRPPRALVALLRTRNGGALENSDFKFGGKRFNVWRILSVSESGDSKSIQPCSRSSEPSTPSMALRNRKRGGDPSRLICFAEADNYGYALDYNHLNSEGEPTVVATSLDTEELQSERVADSFSGFLNGQYFGDAEPIVQVGEAENYKVIAEGGYKGIHTTGYAGMPETKGASVSVAWKICAHRKRLIVFAQENWGLGEIRRRAEFCKADLYLTFTPVEDVVGFEIEPELAENIRPSVEVEILEEYTIAVEPKCYAFIMYIPPWKQKWIVEQRSEASKGLWKNDTWKTLVTSVYSADERSLENAIKSVAQS